MNRSRTPQRFRLLAAALALMLSATACGSSADTVTDAAADADTVTDAAADAVADGADALPEVVDDLPSADADADTDADSEADAVVEPDSETAPAATDAGDTVAGIDAALWGDNVTITMGNGSFTFASNGLPNHELPDQFLVPNEGNMPPFDGDDIAAEFYIANTDDLIVESPLDVEITLNPVYSEEVTETSLSTIGVLISGAPLFNDYEDMSREFVALDDNISLDGVYFIDACNGHPLASGDSYHYHGVPYCITDSIDVAGEHSTIIGVLLDGFPIYGPQDADGEIITSAELDECSGHVGPTPEFPNGIYHYHLTEDANPYSIDCFHGEIDYGGAGGGQGGEQQGGRPEGERPEGGAPEGGAPEGGAPEGGPGGPPDFAAIAETLGVGQSDLEAALGQPPFDLDAAAATLGISVTDLEGALPPPPQ